MLNTTTKKEKHFVPTLEQFCDIHARRATLTTLKKIYLKSCNPLIEEMRNDCKAYFFYPNSYKGDGNGLDCYMVAYEIIWDYVGKQGKRLTDIVEVTKRNVRNKETGQLEEEIKERDVFSSACKAVTSYIDHWRKYELKRTYIEDFSQKDKDGNRENEQETTDRLIRISNNYDVQDFATYIVQKEMLSAVNLTPRQKQIVHYCRQGFSDSEIAKILGVGKSAISKQKEKMDAEFSRVFPEEMAQYKKEKAKAK